MRESEISVLTRYLILRDYKSFRHINGTMIYLFIYFKIWPCSLWDLSSPTRDQTQPQQWKHRVLTTEWPRNSLWFFFFFFWHMIFSSPYLLELHNKIFINMILEISFKIIWRREGIDETRLVDNFWSWVMDTCLLLYIIFSFGPNQGSNPGSQIGRASCRERV